MVFTSEYFKVGFIHKLMTKLISAVVLLVLTSYHLTVMAAAPVATNNGFSPLPTEQNGRILISGYRIPKSEPGISAYYLLAALSTPNTQVPFKATIYDVTNEPQLVGELSGMQWGVGLSPAQWRGYGDGWLEFDAPVGKHLLMLIVDGMVKGSSFHTDMIEVNVEPQKVTHVSLSQYGFMRFPYFGEIVLDQKHYDFCTSLFGKELEKAHASISQYMVTNNIDAKSTDFANYCQALYMQTSNIKPNDTLIKKFAAEKTSVEEIKTSHYKSWTQQPEKPVQYDLMKAYEEPKKATTNGLVSGGN